MPSHHQDGGRDRALPDENRTTPNPLEQTNLLSCRNSDDDNRWLQDRNLGEADLQAREFDLRGCDGERDSGFDHVSKSPCHTASSAHIYGSAGPHRGKGPIGYRRSDERIHELVCEALADDDQLDASRIEVSVTNSDVTLSGIVDDRRAKLGAEDCAYSVSGVRYVKNLLSVLDDRPAERANPVPA